MKQYFGSQDKIFISFVKNVYNVQNEMIIFRFY